MPLRHAMQISARADGAVLTPEQQRFNDLIHKINQARETLAAWRDGVVAYRRAQVERLLPLQQALALARREQVFALDALLDQPGWNRAECSTLQDLVCEIAGQLLDQAGDDAGLKALFDKHSPTDFDTDRQQAGQALQRLAEGVTGWDLGEGGEVDSEAELFRRLHERLAQQRAADAQAAREARAPRHRQTKAAKQRALDEQQASSSVRDVYRKLASALHPDRATGAAQRDAKTALMQQVNQAYEAGDLLALLELQLQIEQVDAGHIAQATAQRIKHYNQVLAEQLSGLQAEITRFEGSVRQDAGLPAGLPMAPGQLGGLVEQSVRELRAALASQQAEQRVLGDRAATRRWLKRQRLLMREIPLDDDLF